MSGNAAEAQVEPARAASPVPELTSPGVVGRAGLPLKYFPQGICNPGFAPPAYLADPNETAKILPPAKVRTFEERLSQDLDDKERAKYHEFREYVLEQGWTAWSIDEWTTLRFLIARQYDLKKAKAMLAKHVEWRQSYVPELRWCDACAKDPTAHMQQFAGWDLQHRPVMYMSYLHCTDRKDADAAIAHNVMCFRVLDSYMPEGVEQWVSITDFVSFSAWQDARSGVGSKVLQVMQDHYPERLAMQVLIDPPTGFWVLWKILQPFIDEKTKKKVKVDSLYFYKNYQNIYIIHNVHTLQNFN